MNSTFLDLLYSTLIQAVPKIIAILVPLIGAFWIFKVRERTAAEGKIFELGREIANILQAKKIIGPMDGISSHYIEKAKNSLSEPNHEKALQMLLQAHLIRFKPNDQTSGEDEKESAEIIVALATERLHQLVPPTVNWSGRGVAYSPFGLRTEVRDTYFPFGTKLFRQWIDRFGDISKDLWAISESRRFFIDSFVANQWRADLGIDEKFVRRWLDEIDALMKDIRPIHSKLLTQLQTIDTQIDLPRLGRDILALGFYVLVLSVVGFFIPKLLQLNALASLSTICALATATILTCVLIGLRIVTAAKPVQDKYIQRRIFLPSLYRELRWMQKRCVRYSPHAVNNILSMATELRLSSRLRHSLMKLAKEIQGFNDYATRFFAEASRSASELEKKFPTIQVNQHAFTINLADLTDPNFSFEQIQPRILHENCNLQFSEEEPRSSRVVATINLSSLSEAQRLELCRCVDGMRTEFRRSSMHQAVVDRYAAVQGATVRSLRALSKMMGKKTIEEWGRA